MNDYTLENFISYCDDMQIAEEGLKEVGKGIFIHIKNLINKILTFLKNLLYNVHLVENAKMSSDKLKDLQLLIQNSQPRRTFINSFAKVRNLMIKVFNTLNIEKDNTNEEEQMLIDDMKLSIDDIHSTYTDVKESKEYKRIQQEENYRSDNMVNVPLSNVVSAIKKAQKEITNYSGQLDTIENKITGLKKESQYLNLTRELFIGIIKVYQLQSSLLSIFFRNTQKSVGAIASNIKDIKNKSVDLKRNYTGKTMFAKSKTKQLNDEDMDRFIKLHETVLSMNNDLSKFDEYKKAREEMCKIAGVPNSTVLMYYKPLKEFSINNKIMRNTLMVTHIQDKSKEMKLLENMQLYHTSPNPNLTKLTPHYYFASKGYYRLWETPRCYFAISNAIGRDGSKFNGKDIETGEKSFKYAMSQKPTMCKIDNEMANGIAVYVESVKDIPVKKI